jgi:hypothetical protein
LPIYLPHPPAPPQPEPTWYERLRKHPAVVIVVAVVAAMAGFEVIRVFVTQTLPWLTSLAEPVERGIGPMVGTIARSGDAIAVAGVVVSVLAALDKVWDHEARRWYALGKQHGREDAEREALIARAEKAAERTYELIDRMQHKEKAPDA